MVLCHSWSLPQTRGCHWTEMGLTCLPIQAFPCMLAHHCPGREHMRTLRRDHITHVALVLQGSGGVCIPAQPSTLEFQLTSSNSSPLLSYKMDATFLQGQCSQHPLSTSYSPIWTISHAIPPTWSALSSIRLPLLSSKPHFPVFP